MEEYTFCTYRNTPLNMCGLVVYSYEKGYKEQRCKRHLGKKQPDFKQPKRK